MMETVYLPEKRTRREKVLFFFHIVWGYLAVSYLMVLLFYPNKEPAIFGAVIGVFFGFGWYVMSKFFGSVVDKL